MAFGVKFTPLTPAHSRRNSLADATNTSVHFPSKEVNKAIHYFDAIMSDFFRTGSRCDNNSSSPAIEVTLPQINVPDDEKMDVDSKLGPLEEYDLWSDLAFIDSINSPHFDFPFPTQSDSGLSRMAELRALLLETFPDGMPKEIDYESILANQHVPSDPLDPSFWDYFQGSAQTESSTLNEQ